MGVRRIRYASANDQTGGRTEYSSASTWGELKNEFPDIAAKAHGMKAWVKIEGSGSNGLHLNSDGVRLPDGDVDIYFLVDKNDSGANDVIPEVAQAIEDYINGAQVQEDSSPF